MSVADEGFRKGGVGVNAEPTKPLPANPPRSLKAAPYMCPECTYSEHAITTKREANALFRHLVEVHPRGLAESVVRSQLDVRTMTSGPPDFRDLWGPPE